MPVHKVPVVHKFGIISPSHRVALQERLRKQNESLHAKGGRFTKPSRNPLEVTEEFILVYNTVEGDKKEKMENKAVKILEKLKRQSGIRTGGIGSYVDLPIAWTEMSQLSQCKGHLQQECYDVLLVSLDQSPAFEDHVVVLFFLAESVLYWLRTEVIYEEYFGSLESRLLSIGEKVFSRLFYHHMCGHTHSYADLKKRLFTYLDGLDDSQKVYKPYPHALFCIRFISSVGRVIVGDVKKEDSEEEKLPEAAKKPDARPTEHRELGLSRTSTSLSSSVHELVPTLFHSLDVWRCVNQMGGGLTQALMALLDCSIHMTVENWVDVACALEVLGDASKSNQDALTTLQQMACGVREVQHRHTDEYGTHEIDDRMNEDDEINEDEDEMKLKSRLPAIDESDLSFRSKRADDDDGRASTDANEQRNAEVYHTLPDRDADAPLDRDVMLERSAADAGDARGDERQSLDSQRTDEDSNVSSDLTFVEPEVKTVGLRSWRWELVLKYVDILTWIAVSGSSSSIRRQALVGSNKTTDYIEHTARIIQNPLRSAGLFDLLFLRNSPESGEQDWSWRIRFVVFLNLIKIHSLLTQETKMKDGTTIVISKMLQTARRNEKDARVLEAFRVAQVDANLEILLHKYVSVPHSSLGARMGEGLSALYLPPLLPPHLSVSKTREVAQNISASNNIKKHIDIDGGSKPRQPLRTSLKDEITLAVLTDRPKVTYESRNAQHLRNIVNDQWRKELQLQMDEERKKKLQEIEEGGARIKI